MNPPLVEWTREIAARLGPAPRRPGWFERTRFSTPRPPWCVTSDPLMAVFREKRRLLQTGEVKLGLFLRYDRALAKRGSIHGAADVIYVADEHGEVMPDALASQRDSLFSLDAKGTDVSPEQRRFVEFLNADDQRGFGVRVPRASETDPPAAVSSLIVYRNYLPGGVLTRQIVPVLVTPAPPRVALPIPKAFWPDEMYDWWLAT